MNAGYRGDGAPGHHGAHVLDPDGFGVEAAEHHRS